MLKIKNLYARILPDTQKTEIILSGINLTVSPGEVHAIMGPNGSGKSTLANILAGKSTYEVTADYVHFKGEDLLPLTPEERAKQGLFLAFQYPIEIPGVNNLFFLRTTLNNIRAKQALPPIDVADFLLFAKEKIKLVGLSESFFQRAVNVGFSGGEKKRNEILQALILEPYLMILDEIDSGLDIDALQEIAHCINGMRNLNRSFILITHYQRLLDYIKPDFVHIMVRGNLIKSGKASLAKTVEEQGYAWFNSSSEES